VIGAGFAGASVAAALTRAGVTSGIVIERDPLPGSHASGRNAAMARQPEANPALLKLAIEGVRRLCVKNVDGRPVLRQTGGLYLIHGKSDRAAEWRPLLHHYCVPSELWPTAKARQRFLFLREFEFDYALFCPTDGIVDIHALLSDLLAEARAAGFEVITDCACESLMFDGSVVCGVRTPRGEIRARIVVDATGAWAGYLGRESAALPLKRLRRHLFVSGDSGLLPRGAPLVWDLDVGYYVRPEGAGLLLCPCDESEHAPGIPEVDSAAEDLLVEKLLKHAPGLANISLRRNWACLRTFAPDRLPVIGWDPEIDGLFHVSGLGGFGVTTSLAVGDIASTLILWRRGGLDRGRFLQRWAGSPQVSSPVQQLIDRCPELAGRQPRPSEIENSFAGPSPPPLERNAQSSTLVDPFSPLHHQCLAWMLSG
jgi:D-arginine dehydrogenase